MEHSKAFKEKEYLTLLSKTGSKKKRNVLLDLADKEQIGSICEIILNLLTGNLPVGEKEKRKLNKHKSTLRELSKKKLSLKKRKQILKQKGGFLSVLLPLAVSALTSVIPQIISSIRRRKR